MRCETVSINYRLQVSYRASPDLKLGGDEHGGGADQLQHLPVDRSLRQVVVCHLDGQVQSFMVELEVLLKRDRKQNPVRASRRNCRHSRITLVLEFCLWCSAETSSQKLTCTSTSQSIRIARISALRLGCMCM